MYRRSLIFLASVLACGLIIVIPPIHAQTIWYVDANPLFVTGPLGDYYLLQPVSNGVSLINPCVDAGDPEFGMINGTTRIDEVQDFGIIDMGYHYLDEMSYVGQNHWLEEIPDFGDELHIRLGN